MNEVVFRNLDEIPERYRSLLERMVNKGIIGYDGGIFEYEITIKDINIFIILDRLNVI